MRTAEPSLPATVSASAIVSVSSSSIGTARLIRPSSRARSVSTNCPVVSISKACLRGTLRESATIGVEQNSPILTPLTPKRVPSAATAMSQLATSWQPAAVAMPCGEAMTGCGVSRMAGILGLPGGLHLLEVVAGAERLARAGECDHADVAIAREPVELGLERGEHLVRQRVEIAGRIHGEPGDCAGVGAVENCHLVTLLCCDHCGTKP